MPAKRAASSRARSKKGPVCGFEFVDASDRSHICRKTGRHLCEPRALRVKAFFSEVLVHTKGRFARQPFVLAKWQWLGIIRPLFGTVVYDEEIGRYVRQYRLAWVELPRKNGKSELLAGIAMYLLIADDEEQAEIYGAARDRNQARKVYDVAERMVKLSPVLNPLWRKGILKINVQEKRIIYEPTGSYYEVITADDLGELGHNPHGVMLDEVIAQRSDRLYTALKTAKGTREQQLMVCATTAGDDPSSFAAKEHKEMEKVAEDPSIAPHIFVYMRNLARDADVWNENNWRKVNPALGPGPGSFLSVRALREDATEAKQDPTKENAFRQFRTNQWVQQTTRYMPLHLWDKCVESIAPEPYWLADGLDNHKCFASLDLAAKFDLNSWTLLFPLESGELLAVWRYWLPEQALPSLDKLNAGQFSVWAKEGWIKITDGDVIDYETIYTDIVEDAERFAIVDLSYDPWSGEPVIQEIEKRTGLTCLPVSQDYAGMSYGTTELLKVVRSGHLEHGGNPVTRFCIDSMEVKKHRDNPDLIKPVKPDRQKDGKRIDGGVTLIMDLDAYLRRGQVEEKKRRKVRAI